jgi:hypothetical protein
MLDQTLLFVDFRELSGQVGRTFRSIPSEVESIVANLSLANMDFAEFADNANPDGIFCGDPRPGRDLGSTPRPG